MKDTPARRKKLPGQCRCGIAKTRNMQSIDLDNLGRDYRMTGSIDEGDFVGHEALRRRGANIVPAW